MSDRSLGSHAGGERETDGPEAPEPTYAERARTLVYVGRVGTLATASRKHLGWPFGSITPYALGERGTPIFLMSDMAVHTQNIGADPRASLLVAQSDWSGDPLGGGRVTLMGRVSPVPVAAREEARRLYLARYEKAKYWVDFTDFAFYRLDVLDVYFVGGFGVMGWVSAEEYALAEPDPLADAAPAIIQHMNSDHADVLLVLARTVGSPDIDEAVMTAVDRLGFHVRLRSGDRIHGARIPFGREVTTPQETRAVVVDMVREAKKRG